MTGQTDDIAPARARKREGAQDAAPLPSTALTVLRGLADAEDADAPRPSLDTLARMIGTPNRSRARYLLLLLSDRRLIGGYGTARRLTDAGWETLDAAEGGAG